MAPANLIYFILIRSVMAQLKATQNGWCVPHSQREGGVYGSYWLNPPRICVVPVDPLIRPGGRARASDISGGKRPKYKWNCRQNTRATDKPGSWRSVHSYSRECQVVINLGLQPPTRGMIAAINIAERRHRRRRRRNSGCLSNVLIFPLTSACVGCWLIIAPTFLS